MTRVDSAVAVASRAVRISSRAARVFPALSLRCVRPSYGTFSLMVFQGNCARGRTGHMISTVMSYVADMSSDGMWNTQPIISCILSNNTQLKTGN